MKKLKNFLLSFKCLNTLDDVYYLDLIHIRNVYGDEINRIGCRSLWKDEYGFKYYCQVLYDDTDILFKRKIKIKKLLKNIKYA